MEFDALEIEDVRRWRSEFSPPADLLDTVQHWVGLPGLAVSMQLLMPTFVRVRGCVLLPWTYVPKTFEDWWTSLDGNVARIESVLNHLHLWDLTVEETPDDDTMLQALGEGLARSWSQELARQVPEHAFDVYFTDDESDYGPTVGFARSS